MSYMQFVHERYVPRAWYFSWSRIVCLDERAPTATGVRVVALVSIALEALFCLAIFHVEDAIESRPLVLVMCRVEHGRLCGLVDLHLVVFGLVDVVLVCRLVRR
jgi:hypothetical protein